MNSGAPERKVIPAPPMAPVMYVGKPLYMIMDKLLQIMPPYHDHKPAHLVTSIKYSPVLKGNFSCPVIENLI
jgi:hypothetical protein